MTTPLIGREELSAEIAARLQARLGELPGTEFKVLGSGLTAYISRNHNEKKTAMTLKIEGIEGEEWERLSNFWTDVIFAVQRVMDWYEAGWGEEK